MPFDIYALMKKSEISCNRRIIILHLTFKEKYKLNFGSNTFRTKKKTLNAQNKNAVRIFFSRYFKRWKKRYVDHVHFR